jgi:hypothetical protein
VISPGNGIITNPVLTNANLAHNVAANQALMSIQYLSTPQTPLFVGSDISALRPNQYTSSITTDVQAPVWNPALINQPAEPITLDFISLLPDIYSKSIVTDVQAPAWVPALVNQPAEFIGSDIFSLLPNQNMNVSPLVLQAPTWLPAVALAPQLAQFAGIDVGALRPDLYTSSIITAIQAPTWIASTLIPQPSLFVGSDIYALRPNTNWTVPNIYLQGPEWLQLPIQPIQSTTTIIASLLANQISLQSLLNDAIIPVDVVEQEILIKRWWRRWSLFFAITVTEALGAVTESVVVNKISGSIIFIFNKLQTFVDQW